MSELPENNVTLFKNVHGNVNACLRSGETISFIQGKFFTTKKSLQDAIQAAVDNDNEFGIYVDPEEPYIDVNAATPLEQLRKKLRQEILDEIASGKVQLKDLGVSRQSEAQVQAAVGGTNTIVGAAPLTEESLDIIKGQTEQATDTLVPATSPSERISEDNTTVVETTSNLVDSSGNPIQEQSAGLSALEKLKQGKPVS